jgi:preprotein translocase subunit SecA
MREVERVVLLNNVDHKWMDHIDDMDQLKHGISLRAYGQKDPVIEFQYEGYDMFEAMTNSISDDTAKTILNVSPVRQIAREQVAVPNETVHGGEPAEKKPVRVGNKVGPNDPCPCGSGKKYKKCCRE